MATEGKPDFRAIKQAVTIPMVLARYGIELRKKNATSYRGKCPLPSHNSESDDTFSVNNTKGTWVWSCMSESCAAGRGEKKREGHGFKRGGDLLDFVRFKEGVSLYRAGELLMSWFSVGGSMPATEPVPQASDAAPQVNVPLAVKFGDPDYTGLHGIDSGHEALVARGFDREECEYLGVGFYSGKGQMSGRIVFPIHNEEGQLVSYAGRSIDPNCAHDERWRFYAGFWRGAELWNLHRVEGETVVVCESFWGVLACIRAGILNAVALMGNHATDQQLVKLCRFSHIVTLLDGDKWGEEGTKDLIVRLVNAGAKRIDVRALPHDAQPDELPVDDLFSLLSDLEQGSGRWEALEEPTLRLVVA
jgi:hypothetical protein